jgi:hypothetical protein
VDDTLEGFSSTANSFALPSVFSKRIEIIDVPWTCVIFGDTL